MKLKKLAIAAATAGLVVSLAACGGDKTAITTPSNGATSPASETQNGASETPTNSVEIDEIPSPKPTEENSQDAILDKIEKASADVTDFNVEMVTEKPAGANKVMTETDRSKIHVSTGPLAFEGKLQGMDVYAFANGNLFDIYADYFGWTKLKWDDETIASNVGVYPQVFAGLSKKDILTLDNLSVTDEGSTYNVTGTLPTNLGPKATAGRTSATLTSTYDKATGQLKEQFTIIILTVDDGTAAGKKSLTNITMTYSGHNTTGKVSLPEDVKNSAK